MPNKLNISVLEIYSCKFLVINAQMVIKTIFSIIKENIL